MYASVNMTEKLVTVNTNPSQFLDMHACWHVLLGQYIFWAFFQTNK